MAQSGVFIFETGYQSSMFVFSVDKLITDHLPHICILLFFFLFCFVLFFFSQSVLCRIYLSASADKHYSWAPSDQFQRETPDQCWSIKRGDYSRLCVIVRFYSYYSHYAYCSYHSYYSCYSLFAIRDCLPLYAIFVLFSIRFSRIFAIITHPLIFERFYWLLYVTWYKFSGQLSRNNPRPIRYLSSDFFRRGKK